MSHSLFRAAAVCAFALSLSAGAARAQTTQTISGGEVVSRTQAAPATPVSGNLFGLDEVRRQLSEQREEIELLRAALRQQAGALEELRARVERAERGNADAPRAAGAVYVSSAGSAALTPAALKADSREAAPPAQGSQVAPPAQAAQGSPPAQGPKPTEAAVRALATMTFSGDIRLRYEALYGQQNALASADAPGALGNPLSARNRLRLRARLAARGKITDEFEWGLRLATGSPADIFSANQTITDFYSHKNFALDQAFITYKPAALPGLQIQGGKFDAPWWRTELTWDNDISPEGLNERYAYRPKDSKVRELAFAAWQLPFLERNAAFVLGADGAVDFEQSRRGGRDLALYGGQARAEFAPTATSLLRLAVTDSFYSGTQFINPAQFFGPNVQFPVTVNLPATPTTPARTVTAQVSIPRDLLLSGNANLGVSPPTNNTLNRDGRLASGFNLVELYAQLELNRQGRWPFLTIFNLVKNTQARDFFAAGAGGADELIENGEDQGVWAEFQIGRDLLRLRPEDTRRGDVLFNYTYIRVEKDAVLTPFNYNELVQQSDVRAHRLILAYAVDPRVSLSLTSIFSRRANGLGGPFAPTPPGSLNRTLTRLQFDTMFRF